MKYLGELSPDVKKGLREAAKGKERNRVGRILEDLNTAQLQNVLKLLPEWEKEMLIDTTTANSLRQGVSALITTREGVTKVLKSNTEIPTPRGPAPSAQPRMKIVHETPEAPSGVRQDSPSLAVPTLPIPRGPAPSAEPKGQPPSVETRSRTAEGR